MQQNTLFHALMVQEPPPPGSEAEAKKKTDWAAARRAKRFREEHDPEFYAALAHPWFFEEFYFFEDHVFPEPTEEQKRGLKKGSKKSKEDYKELDQQANATVVSFLEQFERRNGGPPPDLTPGLYSGEDADPAAPIVREFDEDLSELEKARRALGVEAPLGSFDPSG